MELKAVNIAGIVVFAKILIILDGIERENERLKKELFEKEKIILDGIES